MIDFIISMSTAIVAGSISFYIYKTNKDLHMTKEMYQRFFFPIYVLLKEDDLDNIPRLKSRAYEIAVKSDGSFPFFLYDKISNLTEDNIDDFSEYITRHTEIYSSFLFASDLSDFYGKKQKEIRGLICLGSIVAMIVVWLFMTVLRWKHTIVFFVAFLILFLVFLFTSSALDIYLLESLKKYFKSLIKHTP